tara:strand:+ start:66 stop:401 length:336 start_codon:yes stop_codon:yes gene_type:complete
MAIPSGSGTEVLKNHEGIPSNTAVTLTAGTNKVITIVNMVFHASQSNASKLYMTLNNGSTNYQLLYKILPGYSTYVWNETIVLTPGNLVTINEVNNYAMPTWISYIEQDWT